jgi:hypothetical protein
LRASAAVLDLINPEHGVGFGELFISDLNANDLDEMLTMLSAKFRTKDFFDKNSLSFNLAYQTFQTAKESGISSNKFKKLVRDFVVKFKYTINHWQPDDILKLAEQPRLYPRSWVMRQMKDDPKVWEKLAMYEVGDHVLYAWKWEDVPLKRFVPRRARAEEFNQKTPPTSPDNTPQSPLGKRGGQETSEFAKVVKENLKLKIKLDEMVKEKNEFLRKMADLQELVEGLRRKNSEKEVIGGEEREARDE